MEQTQYHHNPVYNFLIVIVSILVAEGAPQLEIPIIFMQLIQIAAWSIGIAVGIVTIYKFIKSELK